MSSITNDPLIEDTITTTDESFLNDAIDIVNGNKAVVPQNIEIHKEYLFYL